MTAADETVSRLGAANQARRDARTEKLAREIVGRLADTPDAILSALAVAVLTEHYRRRGYRD